jgi:hypothetical protein
LINNIKVQYGGKVKKWYPDVDKKEGILENT